MKKFIFFVLLISTSMQLIAQNNPQIVKAKKMFFAEELNLTVDQVESFWPVYTDMRNDLKKIAHDKNLKCSDPEEFKECLNSDEDFVKIRNQYLTRIAEKIGRDKASRIPSVEKDFIKMVKKRIN